MQIALVLSDKTKSYSVIMMFSENWFGILNIVWKIFPIARSNSSCSTSSTLVSLVFLSFLIIKLSVWVSPTSTHCTKVLSDVPVDGSDLTLLRGMSIGGTVAIQPNDGFSPRRTLFQIGRLVVWFVPLAHLSVGYTSTLALANCDPLASTVHHP